MKKRRPPPLQWPEFFECDVKFVNVCGSRVCVFEGRMLGTVRESVAEGFSCLV